MLNIAICDDDIQITGKIERLLQDIAKRNFVDTEIREKIIEEIKIDVDLYKKHLVSNRALYNDIKNS